MLYYFFWSDIDIFYLMKIGTATGIKDQSDASAI